MRAVCLATLKKMSLVNVRSLGRRNATIMMIPARTIAADVTPARLATKFPEIRAPTINNRDHDTDESIQAVPSAHVAAAGSLPNLTKRRNVKVVPAPGPIRGSVKEIAFPMVAVAAIHGIEM
jgi:hypothetical protein